MLYDLVHGEHYQGVLVKTSYVWGLLAVSVNIFYKEKGSVVRITCP